MKLKLLIILLFSAGLLLSCNNKRNYKVAVSASTRMAEYKKLEKINRQFIKTIGRRFKFNLVDDKSFLLTTNYKLLLDGSFDMALIANSNSSGDDSSSLQNVNIKAVLPVNSRIFYIIYNKDKISPDNIESLFENRTVAILSNETEFIKKILSDFGVNINKVNFLKSRLNMEDGDVKKMSKKVRDSISKVSYFGAYKKNKPVPYDIEVGFTSNDFSTKGRLHKFLNTRKEFIQYSLDDYRLFRNGSKAEGFCLRNTYFTPFLLPKGAFGEYPETPVLTIREDFILAAREDVDDEFIYDLVKVAIEETDLIDMVTYGSNFNNIKFAYPLHEGTIRYLDKNAPNFLEKYGELLAKIGAGVGGLYTAMMGFLLWRKRRRRRTIGTDFQKTLDIQAKLNNNNTTEELESMYKQLQDIQMDYQLKMAGHKILVDDTLRIFFEMIYKNERYILEEMKKRN
ncbi:MAG: TAXI family TRAP transporter solute-binding subunit [bacterium]